MNNLLELLLKSMTQQSSIDAAEKKTGIKARTVLTILSYALPLLMKALTKNASSQSGAQSLLGALAQHTSNKAMPAQISEADAVDGGKIIGHILGNDLDSSVRSIADKSGVSAGDVMKVLAIMAPALLSSISSAAKATQQAQQNQKKGVDLSDGLDVSDLVGIFQSTTNNGVGGLLGTLLGGQTQAANTAANDGTALLSSLLSLMKQ